MSVGNYHYLLCNNPEERSSQVIVCWAYRSYDNQKAKSFYDETKIAGNAFTLRAVKKLPVKSEVSVSSA